MAHFFSDFPGYEAVENVQQKLFENYGVEVPWWIAPILFVVGVFAFHSLSPMQSVQNWNLVLFFMPLWLPLMLLHTAFGRWYEYLRWRTSSRAKRVLLEIRIPREVHKTPLAMETVLTGLHIGIGESNWHKKFVAGGVRPWWSLEIVSIDGRVRFFVWTLEYMRPAVENYLYAQYSNIEIMEAEDYSRVINPITKEYSMDAFEFELAKPDPYPIRTYIDFGLDKPGSAEPDELVDPLAQVIELMGSFKPGQQLWLQIGMRVAKDEKYKGKKNKDGKPYTWKDQAKEEIEKIRAKATSKTKYKDPVTGKTVEIEGNPNPTKGESETMAAIERNTSKLGFEVGMRAIYMQEKARPYAGAAGAFVSSMLKPFNSEQLNSFKPAPVYSGYFKGYPWEDKTGEKKLGEMEDAVNRYRRRAFFYPPYVSGHTMVLSTEELATIFHIPSSTVSTPAVPRMQSSTSEAPSNLPT